MKRNYLVLTSLKKNLELTKAMVTSQIKQYGNIGELTDAMESVNNHLKLVNEELETVENKDITLDDSITDKTIIIFNNWNNWDNEKIVNWLVNNDLPLTNIKHDLSFMNSTEGEVLEEIVEIENNIYTLTKIRG